MVKTVTSTISLTKTATDDNLFQITDHNIPYKEINVHIYDHDAYYGNGTINDAIASANSVLSFTDGDIHDLFFKNRNAGNNTRIVIVATVVK